MNPSAASEDTKPAPSEFEKKGIRQFKSQAPKRGQKSSFDGSLPAMEADDAAVICPWDEFADVELNDVAQFGTV